MNNFLSSFRAHRRQLAAQSAAYRQLRQELSAFNTESARNELVTIIDRYPAETTVQLRDILETTR